MPEEAVSIRTEVFIDEQHFKNEFDDIANLEKLKEALEKRTQDNG